ncbi:MAG TPA: 3-hydroxyacyl-CoA dehydrogenase NAD-binding domain-containing protein, partial [Stellaceae bacterium]
MATPTLKSIRTVGVIGAGQMGSGIAHVCALAGYDVSIADLNESVLQKAINSIDNNLGRQVARGRVTEED